MGDAMRATALNVGWDLTICGAGLKFCASTLLAKLFSLLASEIFATRSYAVCLSYHWMDKENLDSFACV